MNIYIYICIYVVYLKTESSVLLPNYAAGRTDSALTALGNR